MAEESGGVPIICPHESIWLAVAAGTETSKAMASLSAHAAECEHCGPLLRDAVCLLADNDDPVENDFVSALPSSQSPWQRDIAHRLAAKPPLAGSVRSTYEKPVQAESDRRDGEFWAQGRRLPLARTLRPVRRALPALATSIRFPAMIRGWLALNWRLASMLTAACLVLGLLSLTITRNKAPLVKPAPSMVARSQTPPASALPRLPPTIPAPDAAPRQLLAALILEPGLARGLDHSPVLTLQPETQAALVTLLFIDAVPQKLHVELLDSLRRNVWSKETQPTGREVTERQVTIRIPATVMRTEDYEIAVSDPTGSGEERIASYRYKVIRHQEGKK